MSQFSQSEVPGLDLGVDGYKQFQGRKLSASFVASQLLLRCSGLSIDPAGRRLNCWTPRQSEFQGVFHYHKHICSMDRGNIPEMPVWDCKNSPKQVTFSRAMRADVPVMSIEKDPDGNEVGDPMCWVWQKLPEKIHKGGWRETFSRLLDARLPGIDQPWLEKTFGVSLSGYKRGRSYIGESYNSLIQVA